MKPEQSEQFLIEELFEQSIKSQKIQNNQLRSIDKLTGDASTRRYYRVFTTQESYVVCLDNPTTKDEENTFVSKQRFLELEGIRVPIIYDRNEARGYILEEDLGDVTLLTKLAEISDKKMEYDLYKQSIDQLLLLHKMDQKKLNQSHLFELSFDAEKLNSEIDFTVKYFINNYLKIESLEYHHKIAKCFEPICERLANQKRVLTHRDFHSRNIMCKNDELIIIDFQDARMGIPQYDLASVMDDCYYELLPENKKNLIRYYYDELDEQIHGQGSFEEFLLLYKDMVLQRAFKAVGSFAYIFETRADNRYLKYIGFAMEKIRKIMLDDPRYKSLREELFRVYYAS